MSLEGQPHAHLMFGVLAIYCISHKIVVGQDLFMKNIGFVNLVVEVLVLGRFLAWVRLMLWLDRHLEVVAMSMRRGIENKSQEKQGQYAQVLISFLT